MSAETRRILIVDDEPLSSDPMKIMLEKEGFQVDTALDGLEAQKKFSENTYDLVVTDLGIPFLDGIRLMEWIKETRSVPVILMTGFAEYLSEEAAHEIGADGYLLKPFSLKQARKIVQTCFSF